MSLPDLSIRPRRLRRGETIRRMVRECELRVDDLVQPVFVDENIDAPVPVRSMPGVARISLGDVGDVARRIEDAGVPAMILFGIPKSKDDVGSEAWNDDGIVQRAIRAAKEAAPGLCVIADACFCEYTSHGHCGVLRDGEVENDITLGNLQREALSYARAGVDIIAPSGMMDGMIAAIRSALDGDGFAQVAVMSYAVKYASGYFGPFRDAADSTPSFGDRAGYQMDPANRREALREALLDVEQGADILMVKPALAYMDIIREVRNATHLPLAVYNVSGEYAMIKAASAQGWIDERRVVLETLTGFKRAGADLILTYHALDAAAWLRES